MNEADKDLILGRYVVGREDSLIESYIVDGPTALKLMLSVDEDEWRVIFDYLVFDHNMLYKTAAKNSEFFTDIYIKHGMMHVRQVLDADDEKYDLAIEPLFDLIAIANGGLHYHVLEHRQKYAAKLQEHGPDFIKKVLFINKDKYEDSWGEILELLLSATCERMFSEQAFENSLKAFSMMINGERKHRIIEKEKLKKA